MSGIIAALTGGRRRERARLPLTGSAGIADDEARALIPLLVAKVKAGGAGDGAVAFIEANLKGNLRLFTRRAPRLKMYYRSFGLLTFACGLTSTALAAFSKATAVRIVIAVLGVLVGVITHLLQVWRPAERSGAYYRARAHLLREGWCYLDNAGVYQLLADHPTEQFLKFQSQVIAIESVAAALDEQAEPVSAAAGVPASVDRGGGDPTPPGDDDDGPAAADQEVAGGAAVASGAQPA